MNQTPGDLVPERYIGAHNEHITLYDQSLACSHITPADHNVVLWVQQQCRGRRFAALRSVTHILITCIVNL